ncbi:MAG: hypothetical protein ACTSRZ_05890 [Promethearchaeota archaeon]
MNEAEILIYMLSRESKNGIIGSTQKELLNSLGLSDKNSSIKLLNLMQELNKSIAFLGLEIKFNPVNSYWYIGFKDNISYMLESSNLPKLPSPIAATLSAILVKTIDKGGAISKKDVLQIRNKKNIDDDLKFLEENNFIQQNNNTITLTPKIFYFIDIDEFIAEMKKLLENAENDNENLENDNEIIYNDENNLLKS